MPFFIPYCYLKYHFPIMLPASKHLQSHTLLRGTGTWSCTRSHPSRHHSYISHVIKLPDSLFNLKFVQNLQQFVTGRSSQLSTRTLFSPELHSNCHIPSGNEMHIESPYQILDSALLICIHTHMSLVSFNTRLQRKKKQHKSICSLNP